MMLSMHIPYVEAAMSLWYSYLSWYLSSILRYPGDRSIYADTLLPCGSYLSLAALQGLFVFRSIGHCWTLKATFPMPAHDESHRCRSHSLFCHWKKKDKMNEVTLHERIKLAPA